MQFNSDVFLKFLLAFVLLYHLARRHLQARNGLIVAASYVFYGWWDYRFLALLVATSLLDFWVAQRIERAVAAAPRRRWLGLSLAGNLGVLALFKYFDFFVDSAATLLWAMGWEPHLPTLRLVLPVGISFYTFQTLSYTVDVYRREIPASRDVVAFLAYVSFFPQLVAGPIERASHLLPQFRQPRTITRDNLREGAWLLLWGMFKKVVIADNLAPLVDLVYQNPVGSGPLVVLGTIAFALQIYADFSGYSDIARGLACLLGFDLRWNFNLPYAAGNVRDFWRRWHISLSTWLRDYLYVSLGGNRAGHVRTRLNLLVTMILGGLWHGAAWHFVAWGAWHGVGLLVHRWWSSRQPVNAARWSVTGWLLTMGFVGYGWLLFRANSVEQAVQLTTCLGNLSAPSWLGSYLLNLGVFAAPLLAMQVWQARAGDLMVALRLPGPALALLEGILLTGSVLFWQRTGTAFIYFQF